MADDAAPAPPLSVLVVDDDEYTRVFIGRFLPGTPRIAQAANGREAIDKAMADAPDLIVMDLEMPVMGGLEAAANIREWERREGRARCAMIALSSHEDEAVRARSLAAGFDAYLAKPVSPQALGNALAGLAFSNETVAVDPDLKEAMPGFLKSRLEIVDALALAISQGDAARVCTLAHKAAGSLMLYGFHWAAEKSKMIERRAGENALASLAAETAALRRHLEGIRVRFDEKKGKKEN